MLVVLLLVFTAVYAMIKIPYREAIRLWRGGEEVWYQNPKFAPPAWFNLFSSKKYSESFAVRTSDGSMEKTIVQDTPEISTITISYPFDFTYDFYPQEMLLYVTSKYREKQPFISIEWLTPDGRTVRIANMTIIGKETYRFSQDNKLQTRLKTDDVVPGPLLAPGFERPVKGTVPTAGHGHYLRA
jgi:peptide/nickel transport system permease protein